MRTRDKRPAQRLDDVDPAFDPWEPSKPIPIFLLAVFIALAVWGGLSYLGDLVPERVSARETGVPEGASVTSAHSAGSDSPLLVHRGNAAAWSCASCHGEQGQGAGQTPRLAGLDRSYIVKQLQDFASGSRNNESMQYVAAQLTASEMNEVAKYYAAPSLPTPAVAGAGKEFERGRQLNLHGDWRRDIPACATCHGEAGEGMGATFPRLAGQQPEYLFSQLAAWKGGKRHNSPQSLMDDIASRMSNEDMWAVSQYLGALRPMSAK